MSLSSPSYKLERRILDRWWATPLDQFRVKLNSIIRESDEHISQPVGRKAYENRHKKICNLLHMDEVYTERVYAEATVKRRGAYDKVRYNSKGKVLSYTHDCGAIRSSLRLKTIKLGFKDSDIRVKRMIKLSHALTQCGLVKKAVRPLWRLLRVGYTIPLTNFKRLVNSILKLIDNWSDFTRTICGPTKGLRIRPRFRRDAWTSVAGGIQVPLWTWKTTDVSVDLRALKLD